MLLVFCGCIVIVVCSLFLQNIDILVLNCCDKITFIWLVYALGTLSFIFFLIPLLHFNMEEALSMFWMKRKRKLYGNQHISTGLLLIENILLFSYSSEKNLQFIWCGYSLNLIAEREICIFLIFKVFTKTTFLKNFNTNHYGLDLPWIFFFFIFYYHCFYDHISLNLPSIMAQHQKLTFWTLTPPVDLRISISVFFAISTFPTIAASYLVYVRAFYILISAGAQSISSSLIRNSKGDIAFFVFIDDFIKSAFFQKTHKNCSYTDFPIDEYIKLDYFIALKALVFDNLPATPEYRRFITFGGATSPLSFKRSHFQNLIYRLCLKILSFILIFILA